MAEAFRAQQILHKRETTFAQYAETGTPDWDRSLAYLSADVTLEQPRVKDTSFLNLLSHALPGHHGARRCTLRLTAYLQGHGTTTAGALTQTAQSLILAGAFGSQVVSQSGTTVSAATNATTWSMTSTTNWSNNMVGRVGVKGDSRGDGQAFVYNGGTATKVALPATPNIGDVVYAAQNLYQDDSAALVTERFLVMHSTTGAQFLLAGCAISDVEFRWPIGELPQITITWQGAYWRRVARTFPDANLPPEQPCGPVAGGSFCIQDVGTATRTTKTPSEVNLAMSLGLEPVSGPGALGTFQDITAWARTMREVTLEVKLPWETAWETYWDTANASLTKKHILFTATAVDGKATGFYLPAAFPDGNRPSGVVNIRDQNYLSMSFRAGRPDVNNTVQDASIVFFQG